MIHVMRMAIYSTGTGPYQIIRNSLQKQRLRFLFAHPRSSPPSSVPQKADPHKKASRVFLAFWFQLAWGEESGWQEIESVGFIPLTPVCNVTVSWLHLSESPFLPSSLLLVATFFPFLLPMQAYEQFCYFTYYYQSQDTILLLVGFLTTIYFLTTICKQSVY